MSSRIRLHRGARTAGGDSEPYLPPVPLTMPEEGWDEWLHRIARSVNSLIQRVASGVAVTPTGNISSTNVQAALAELDAEKVAKAGDTMTGNLTIAPAAGDSAIGLQRAAGQGAAIIGRSAAGLNRWSVLVANGNAETGSNNGSDFGISRYTDAGVVIDTPLAINRSSGSATFSSIMFATGHQTRSGVTGSYTSHAFNIDWTGTAQLWIDNVNSGTIAFTSDYRIKTNVAPLSSTWDRVKALRPISYTRKDTEIGALKITGDGTQKWGFIAHELQETLTEGAASGHKDAENLIQSPDPFAILAAVTKALQEAMARIEALEARLA